MLGPYATLQNRDKIFNQLQRLGMLGRGTTPHVEPYVDMIRGACDPHEGTSKLSHFVSGEAGLSYLSVSHGPYHPPIYSIYICILYIAGG